MCVRAGHRRTGSPVLAPIVAHNAQAAMYLNGLPRNTLATFTGHSLGGAIAVCAANFFRNGGLLLPQGVVTFGQPRVGEDQFYEQVTSSYIRWINEADFVPALPPSRVVYAASLPYSLLSVNGWRFTHKTDAFRLYSEPGFDFGGNLIDTELVIPLAQPPSLLRFKLRGFSKRTRSPPTYDEYDSTWESSHCRGAPRGFLSLKTKWMNSINLGLTLGTVEPVLHSPSWWASPDLVWPTDGSIPTIPTADVGRTVEQRTVTQTFYSFGGNPYMAHSYRGETPSHDNGVQGPQSACKSAMFA